MGNKLKLNRLDIVTAHPYMTCKGQYELKGLALLYDTQGHPHNFECLDNANNKQGYMNCYNSHLVQM